MKRLAQWLAATALGSAAILAQAQAWPSKPIKIIVPFPAGGDLEPVARIVENGMLLVAHPSAAANVAQLLALGRTNPGSLTFASSGRTGVSFMASELLAATTGLPVTTVPYKGTGQILPDLISPMRAMSSLPLTVGL